MITKRLHSFRYAIAGIIYVIRTQTNARVHLVAAAGVVALGFWLEVSLTDWCLLTLCISLVIAAEAFNTAVECVVDLVSPQRQELAGRAKDAAAGGVLLTSIGAAVIGAIVFGRRLWPG